MTNFAPNYLEGGVMRALERLILQVSPSWANTIYKAMSHGSFKGWYNNWVILLSCKASQGRRACPAYRTPGGPVPGLLCVDPAAQPHDSSHSLLTSLLFLVLGIESRELYYWGASLVLFYFEIGSCHVAKVPRWDSNLQSSHLSLPKCWIKGMCHHFWLS